MSTNGVNVAEDADMVDCDGEKVVTMMDVLQEQQEFEEDANAVLGASDDKNCTYNMGYIKRQAIYACLTCCGDAKTDPTKRAGVCLACSLNCHENHELIELYTKRNFRCDCGNPKFNGHPCQYVPEKPDLNEDNNYNQNFSGIYCTCHRPYPDPEATFEDEMIQCVVCEDWLHASHLEASLPTNDQYAEMICKACMENNEFLHDYGDIAVNPETGDVDVVALNNTDSSVMNETGNFNGDTEKVNGALEDTNEKEVNNETEVDMENKPETISTKTDEQKTEESTKIAIEKCDDIVPEKVESAKEVENVDKIEDMLSNVEVPADSISQPPDNDNKMQEVENQDVGVECSANNEASDSKADNEESTTEMGEDQSKNTSDESQIKINNDNSVIESIEKLESELGNVETKENIDKINDSEQKEANAIPEVKVGETLQNEQQDETSTTIEKTETEDINSIKDDTISNDLKPDSNVEPDEVNIEDKANNLETNESDNTNGETSENIVSVNNGQNETVQNGLIEEKLPELNGSDAQNDNTKDIKRKFSTENSEDATSKKPKLDSGCLRPNGIKRKFKGATFWPSNFRQKLCTCNECISMYKDLSVLFLIDPEDTVTAYETLGKEKIDGMAASQYEKGLEALSSLGRIQQINALTEYNKMRDKLLDFLKSFKDRKEIVKEEDIKAFFAGMKPKREPDGVYFCR